MERGFPWLPIGTRLPDGSSSGRLLEEGPGWQVCAAVGSGATTVLLLDRDAGAPAWWGDEIRELGGGDGTVNGLPCLLRASGARPATLADLAVRAPVGGTAALTLTRAVLAMAARQPEAGWATALFLPPTTPGEAGLAIATAGVAPGEDRRASLLAALSGGAGADIADQSGVAQLKRALGPHTAQEVLDLLAETPPAPARAPETFALPGQPGLEALLREQVLDVLHRPAAYARLGVGWPGGVLLSGPPGCGKSFAAARLAEFLGWPLHEISVASVGSMWLHETPRQLQAAFARAAEAAPAVVLLEELDALGQSRDGTAGARVEELNTLLREVETAPKRRLLVVGTTNHMDAIDRALVRRGRFDLVFTMDYPDAEAAAAMLAAQLSGRPHAAGMDVAAAGRRLARRPASDLAWVVDQAARLAVRTGRSEIDDLLLARALSALPGRA